MDIYPPNEDEKREAIIGGVLLVIAIGLLIFLAGVALELTTKVNP